MICFKTSTIRHVLYILRIHLFLVLRFIQFKIPLYVFLKTRAKRNPFVHPSTHSLTNPLSTNNERVRQNAEMCHFK